MVLKRIPGRWFRHLNSALLLFTIASLSCKSRDSELDAGNVAESDKTRGKGSYELWSYDEGPLQTAMGRELIKLHADIPYFPGLSSAIYGDQFFRPAFGPIPWRMMQQPDSVKILFIGQDGTHIAEAAGRPATAGFGGRAQDLAEYFGVSSSAAFINTYAFTIKWQYGVFDAPIFSGTSNEKLSLQYGSYVPNPVWLMTQDQDSRITQWRNNLIEWIIRNNRNSLKMIVLFGGAARDAMGAFVESRGGKVGPRYSMDEITKNNIRVGEFELVSAGGNTQASILLNTAGKPMFAAADAATFKDAFNANPAALADQVAFSKGGINGSGLIHPAQLGGYDIAKKMYIDGKQTISLNGLKLSDGTKVSQDVLVTQLPHPSALSKMKPKEAADAVARGLYNFKKFPKWNITADKYFENKYAQDKAFDYGRGDMGPEYYDFGAPNSRMVNVSSASRLKADTIVFGTRDKVRFDSRKLAAMRTAKKPTDVKTGMFIGKEFGTDPFEFDPGPPLEVAKAMKTALAGADKTFLSAVSSNGDYAHYRGTFNEPKVLVIADPHGEDDLITARALTGSRGQMMHDVIANASVKTGTRSTKVGDKYLVLKTVPFGTESTLGTDLWTKAVKNSEEYRKSGFAAALASLKNKPSIVILDGAVAASEFAKHHPEWATGAIIVNRSGDAPESGLPELATALKLKFSSAMPRIPRSHLTYYARTWEGSSGDRVITADGDARGKAFAEVAPEWAYKQELKLATADADSCRKLRKKIIDSKVRLNFKESVPAYYSRINDKSTVADTCGTGRVTGENDEAPPQNGVPYDWYDDGHLMVTLPVENQPTHPPQQMEPAPADDSKDLNLNYRDQATM